MAFQILNKLTLLNKLIPVLLTVTVGNTSVYYNSNKAPMVWTETIDGLAPNLFEGGFGSVCYVNGTWMVAGVSTSTNVYYSKNLTLPWTATTGSSSTIGGVCYVIACGPDPFHGGYIWLAGGELHKISYLADDLLTTHAWTGVYSNNKLINNAVYCFAYGNGLWIAGGLGTINTLLYSDNPTKNNSWTGCTNDIAIFNTVGITAGQCRGIAYGNGLWVAVGSSGASGGNTIATSADGINWSAQANSTDYISSVGYCVTYGKDNLDANIWVAGGSGINTLVYSYNPTLGWNAVPNSNLIFSTVCNKITYSGKLWTAAGQGINTMATSIDGKTWTGLNANSPHGTANIGLSVFAIQ